MNRETNQRFAEIPIMEKPRSKFRIDFNHTTTFNAGSLVPIYLEQNVLPGDTIKINMSSIIRMATPLYPVMGNIYADIYFFYVPYRLIWNHWKEFWGENTNAWYQQIEYEIPQLYGDSTHYFHEKTLGDYFGLPTNVKNLSVSILPFRAYCKIWNDWFRDENLQQETPLTIGDSSTLIQYSPTNPQAGGGPLKVNKFHDYFTSCLPAPQKGNEVLLPLGSWAPLQTRLEEITPSNVAMHWKATNPELEVANGNYTIKTTGNESLNLYNDTIAETKDGETAIGYSVVPSNLWANLGQATAASINQLRQAFAVQRFYEAQARGGSRYIEFIKNIFGVTSPDARLQRSEYLGGARIPLNISQVLQTSNTTNNSPLGQTGAFSHTADHEEYFTKSFTEHGCIIGLCAIRYDHVYNQGIERAWSRKKWTDFYIPQFAHLSEQAVLNKEIYATGTSTDDEVFGYQECWGDYRYKPSIVSGSMRTTYAQTLDAWNLADNYTQQPILGSTWIQEDKSNIDRTLAVSSGTEDQFIADFYFDMTYVRPMPLFSVPGLIDHM